MSAPEFRDPPDTTVHYPESDGQPMGETEVHADLLMELVLMLRHRYRNQDDVHVGGDLLLYYVEGDPKKVIVPDVFVTFGMDKAQRRTYRVWDEGKAPDVVIELTSLSSRYRDRRTKKELYATLGVREYFIFDPLGEYLDPPLQGFTLTEHGYEPMVCEDTTVTSKLLGVRLQRHQARHLELWDIQTGQRLLTPAEQAVAAEQLAERSALQAARIQEEAARAEVEAARAEEEAARAEEEAARAAEEAARAEEEAARAEAEAARAIELAAKLAAYEARFGSLDE